MYFVKKFMDILKQETKILNIFLVKVYIGDSMHFVKKNLDILKQISIS